MKRNNKNLKLKKSNRRAERKLKKKNKKLNNKKSIGIYPDETLMHIKEQMMSPTFGQFYREHDLIKKLSGKDKDSLILIFAGLCFDREHHSTLVIMESIIHQALIMELGSESITKELCSELFDTVSSSYLGTWLDPAEDIMIGAVQTEVGTFKILEGIWESCGFYCQLFLNVVEEMPRREPFESFRRSIHALLLISNVAVERAGLTRYERGNDEPLSELNLDETDLSKTASISRFTKEDLIQLCIDENDLRPFILTEEEFQNLHEERLGESSLEKKPLVLSQFGGIILALPTAIGYSLRMFIIDSCAKHGMLKNLERFYRKSFIDHFGGKSRLLGEFERVPFKPVQYKNEKISGADAIAQIDQGRYIHFILYFDDFESIQRGVNSVSPSGPIVSSEISRAILEVQKNVSNEKGFVRGLSLVIVCGWGRVVAPDLNEHLDKEWWDIEFVSAPDLDTFNRINQMSPLSFWRMIETKRTVEKAGVVTHNLNGLLNLYAWAKSNNHDIVPHDAFPDDLSSPSNFFMMIQLNAYLEIRWEIKLHEDVHRIEGPFDGSVLLTRHVPFPFFKEDKLKPIYVSITDISDHNLVGLVKGEFSYWWCRPLIKNNQDRNFIYKLWETLCGWALRLDKALFKTLSYQLDKQIILEFKVEEIALPLEVKKCPTPDQLSDLINVEIVVKKNVAITVILREGYLAGFHQHENHAESKIVQVLLDNLISHLMPSLNNPSLVKQIFEAAVPNRLGKNIHLNTANDFIDYVQYSLPKALTQDQFDHATLKIGLGWIDDIKPGSSNQISGVAECTDYLRRLTFNLWLQIKKDLNRLNRSALINFLLAQHEAVELDSNHWQRTFTAVLNLHADHDDVYTVVTEKVSSNNAILSGIRILLEMAICEAKDSSEELPNSLDLSRLIMLATSIFQYGNLSDAIHFEMVDPTIKITSLGDVHFNHSFFDLVVAPYGSHVQIKLINSAAKKFATRFDIRDDFPDEDSALVKEFEEAWYDEYNITITTVINIVNLLEDIGIQRKSAVYTIDENELISSAESSGIQREHLLIFTTNFTLPARENWVDIPNGFKVADISPWRFKRRLSSVAKPLFKIDDYIISPNLIRKGVAYLFANSYDGSIDEGFFKSKSMKSWIGAVRDKKGHDFNDQAKTRFEELGLSAEPDVKVSKILQRKLEKDFGDVDVLAWNKESGDIYLVECKDLEFSKTQGEIAKQIYEFRGQIRHDGKDDRLKKHLERCNILKENSTVLKKYLNMEILGEIHIILLFKQVVPIPFHNPINELPIKIVFFDELNLLFKS